jgi:hypothetical protein
VLNVVGHITNHALKKKVSFRIKNLVWIIIKTYINIKHRKENGMKKKKKKTQNINYPWNIHEWCQNYDGKQTMKTLHEPCYPPPPKKCFGLNPSSNTSSFETYTCKGGMGEGG